MAEIFETLKIICMFWLVYRGCAGQNSASIVSFVPLLDPFCSAGGSMPIVPQSPAVKNLLLIYTDSFSLAMSVHENYF